VDLVSVMLSGLAGAVIGSVLSLLGAYKLERWRLHRDEVGAAKALYFETETNAFYLSTMAEQSTFTDLTHQTWDATQSRVANLLAPNDLRVVALAYGDLALCQSHVDAARARAGSVSDLERSIWFDGYNSFLRALVSRFANSCRLAHRFGQDLIGGLDPAEWR
jgi:hypothetical protein